jgi:adenosine deaminase
MGFGDDVLREITRTAIDAAFCDDDLRAVLRNRL